MARAPICNLIGLQIAIYSRLRSRPQTRLPRGQARPASTVGLIIWQKATALLPGRPAYSQGPRRHAAIGYWGCFLAADPTP